MGFFTGLNARILAAIDKRSGTTQLVRVAVVDSHIVLTHSDRSLHEVEWSGLTRVVALRRDLYAGDEVSLLLESSGSQFFEVAASCPGWLDLCAAIDLLEGARPFGEWHQQVLSAGVGQAIDVWSRSTQRA